MIDLRSDTVTRPSAAMRKAMADAPVGDDVFGDDPTVIKLQAVVAELTGKEAALFFPTGTQSNLGALMAHCQRGDEYIVSQEAHAYKLEAGGAAVLGSIQPQPIEPGSDGTMPIAKIAGAFKPADDTHYALTRLVALENTTMLAQVLPMAYMRDVTALARKHGFGTHLDGARVVNAAAALGVSIAEISKPFDTISMCISKGLGAPAGTVLAGPKDLIARAHRIRKMLGGGMRQVGILAAACLYGIENNLARIKDDHANAERLAAGLRTIHEVTVRYQSTNMVFITTPDKHAAALSEALQAKDILMSSTPSCRLALHLDVSTADVDRVIEAFRGYFAGKQARRGAA